MTSPKIYVIIPVFNRLEYTKKCLKSIYSQSYNNYQVILINDGSTDNTNKYINEKYSNTIIIQGDGNWWWTKSMYRGVRLALKYAKASDFILEMNNDLYFDKNYFQELINISLKYKNSLIGSICVKDAKQNEVVEAGIRIDWPTGLVYGVAQTISNQLSYYKNMEIVNEIDALPGKGTLIPVTIFKKGVNFKYKLFPHYIADYEFAINAKSQGFNLVVSTKAIAKHYWDATGISGKANENKRSYTRAINLLFGRKSMNNIIDWFRFIKTSCPKEYRLRNYYFSFLKIIKAVLTVFPFYYLILPLKIISRIYHGTKLICYRTVLKIVQFPKFHLKNI